MFNQNDFDMACQFVYEKLPKNLYYSETNFKNAIKKAKDILQNKKKYKPFASGNAKLEKNILIFDLPSVMTCACNCVKCYAKKAERLFQNTKEKRLYNFILMEYAMINKNFYNKLMNIWKAHAEVHANDYKNPIIRIHASGDFYSENYKIFILEFTKNVEFLEDLKIYTYSKQISNSEIDFINKNYKNFNIIKSMININGVYYVNYGNIDYLIKLSLILIKNKIKFRICDYKMTLDDKKKIKSHGILRRITKGKCGKCVVCTCFSIVLFKEH